MSTERRKIKVMIAVILFILVIILLLVGLIGVIFPVLPGIPFMFMVALVFAALDHFHRLTVTNIVVLAVVALISILIDHLAGFWGAKFFGASKKGAYGGLLGSLVGLFFFPPFGMFIGLALGVYLAEKLLNGSSDNHSAKAASGAVLSALAGMLINLGLAIFFLIYFSILYWK